KGPNFNFDFTRTGLPSRHRLKLQVIQHTEPRHLEPEGLFNRAHEVTLVVPFFTSVNRLTRPLMFLTWLSLVRGILISSSRIDAETTSTMSRLLALYSAMDLEGSIST